MKRLPAASSIRRAATRTPTAGLLVMLLLATPALGAQQPGDATIVAAPAFATDHYVASRAPIELTLSRVPAAAEGRIAVFVGKTDLTALFELDGSRLVFRANGVDMPSGESELTVFLVAGAVWTELSKIPIRVLTPRGFERARFEPVLELRSTGQLAEGHTPAQPAPARPTYQLLAGTVGLQTSHKRGVISLTSDTHLLGANERADALRFAELGDQASRLDLADYVLRLEGGNAALALGHVSAGMNRHLINGFSSRGVTAQVGGPRAQWSLGVENGSSIVGTDNIVGLDRDDHRIVSSSIAWEVLPARAGALHLDATILHGAVRAMSGFTQGGIIAADQSDGYGVQLAASTPAQRIRLAAGLASSSSRYAADPPLLSGGSIAPPPAHRKGARYAELNAGVLQHFQLFGGAAVTLNVAVKHERVDPLYRSVGAYTQSDIVRNGVDLSGTVDMVSVQAAHGRTDDNVDAIATLLTSRTRSSSLNLGTPLASLLRVTRRPELLPTLSYGLQQMHQFGAGVPAGGIYTVSDIPDQVSVMHDAGAQWQVRQWQVAYRVNVSDQDNRQPGREPADFAALTQTVTVGVTAGAHLTLGLDVGVERQENRELAQVSRVRRAGLNGNWRPTPLTTIDGSVTVSRSADPGAGSDTHVSSLQLGVARGIRLWRSADGAPRGQAFLRFSRQSFALFNLAGSFAPPVQPTGSWNLASGLTVRLF